MERIDLVSSEVNCFSNNIDEAGGYVISKFKFSVPTSLDEARQSSVTSTVLQRSRSNPVRMEDSDDEDIEVPCFSSLGHHNIDELAYDSDGDIDVPRLGGLQTERQLLIEHKQHTSLGEVGLQVWRGSLLLSDYILHHHSEFSGKTVLEVGSGTGLASIIASFCGSKTISTDIGNSDILDLIQRNVKLNNDLVKNDVSIRSLDFGDDVDKFEYFVNVETIIAGDIIYDNDVTEKFVKFLCHLKAKVKKKVSVIVAMEKRYVFTVADLDTVAPAYDFFLEMLSTVKEDLSYEHIEANFPQYFCYERSTEMLLIKIETNK